MRIAVMGTGGVGGYFGAKLALAGHDVVFVARGAHLAAIREKGLIVETDAGTLRVERPVVSDDPATLGGPADVLFFAVKLWDSEAAAAQVKPLVGPRTAVVSFQNGVDKDALMRRMFGADAVMGGVVYIGAAIGAPGVIKITGKMQRLVVGEFGAKTSARAEALVEAGKGAGIDAELAPDIERAIWEKFVFLVGISGTTALIRRPLGVVRAVPESRALLLDAMREVVAVARARGIAIAPDFADQRLAFADTLPASMTASMHHDLERGARLEVDFLAGTVVRLGAESGVPTPVNRVIHGALKPHAAGASG